MNQYRDDLPSIPNRLASLPVERGYPVPWFVAKVGDHYDFRVMDGGKIQPAIKKRLCWICGQKLGAYLAFPIGPMCAINRTISEPPSHRECAEWAIKVCPFLAMRQEERHEARLPEGVKNPPGFANKRQPGVVCLWITKAYTQFVVPDGALAAGAEGGLLFELGEPTEVLWFREGRAATRQEVMDSIDSGYPSLLELAQRDGTAGVRELERRREKMLALLPEGS